MAEQRRFALELHLANEFYKEGGVAGDVVLVLRHRCGVTKAGQVWDDDAIFWQRTNDVVQAVMRATKAVYHDDGVGFVFVIDPVADVAAQDVEVEGFRFSHLFFIILQVAVLYFIAIFLQVCFLPSYTSIVRQGFTL